MINPRNSHTPLPDDRRKRCPICRQTVYSSAGIHPQCAIKQSDPWRPSTATPTPIAEAATETTEIEQEAPAAVIEAKAAKPAVASKPAQAVKRKVKQA